jgi:creatinine amidohydrolase
VRTGAGSYWVMAWDELVAAGAQQRGRLPGHAGAFETSVALALRPDLVVDPPHRPGAFAANPAGYFGRFHTEDVTTWESGDGYSDDPSAGDAEAGRRYLEVVVDRVADGLRAFASG